LQGRLKKGLDQPARAAIAFYLILTGAVVLGIAISVAGFNPIEALYWSAVINAVISVPIMIAVMIAASSPKLVGQMPLAVPWRLLGWGASVAMGAATLAMLVCMAM